MNQCRSSAIHVNNTLLYNKKDPTLKSNKYLFIFKLLPLKNPVYAIIYKYIAIFIRVLYIFFLILNIFIISKLLFWFGILKLLYNNNNYKFSSKLNY